MIEQATGVPLCATAFRFAKNSITKNAIVILDERGGQFCCVKRKNIIIMVVRKKRQQLHGRNLCMTGLYIGVDGRWENLLPVPASLTLNVRDGG